MYGQMIGQTLRHTCTLLSALAISLIITASAKAKKYCAPNSGAAAVDLSQPVDQKFLDKMKKVGVETIIRYYDYSLKTAPFIPPTKPPMQRRERDLITDNNFNTAVVFQHNSSSPRTFTKERGEQDAIRVLELANENGQPDLSAIYFGVYYDVDEAHIENIKNYFTAVKKGLAGRINRIGVYGNGLVCKKLIEGNFVELCWLSQSGSFSGTKEYTKLKKYDLLQNFPNEKCGGRTVNFDLTKEPNADFGQFKKYKSADEH